jgi:hypothetical protein
VEGPAVGASTGRRVEATKSTYTRKNKGVRMAIKPGSRWRSRVCETEVIAVRVPTGPVSLGCGGAEMAPHGSGPSGDAELDADHAGGTLLGKRYANEALGLEVLCTKPGAGSLTVDGEALLLKDAKPLPASD